MSSFFEISTWEFSFKEKKSLPFPIRPRLYTSVALVSNLNPPKLGREVFSPLFYSFCFEVVPGFFYTLDGAGLGLKAGS